MDQYQSCDIPASTMIRYTAAPTKYDQAPYGTICAVHINDDGTDQRIYIQSSLDTLNPQWESLEDLVIKAYKPLFNNPCFIHDCLEKAVR